MIKLVSSRGEGQVGIWWFVDGEIWGVSKNVDDGALDGRYIQYDEPNGPNHMTIWESVKSSFDRQSRYSSTSYLALERGRVVYDTLIQVFIVTCSQELVNDPDFRQSVVDFYNLKGNRVEFEALSHYHVRKESGNDALERFFDNC